MLVVDLPENGICRLHVGVAGQHVRQRHVWRRCELVGRRLGQNGDGGRSVRLALQCKFSLFHLGGNRVIGLIGRLFAAVEEGRRGGKCDERNDGCFLNTGGNQVGVIQGCDIQMSPRQAVRRGGGTILQTPGKN